jgi:methionyl-tRNA formyltransferase
VVAPDEKPDYDKYAVGDILISANWRHIIPSWYYEKFKLAVNFHGANTHLKKYRGRRPVQKQIEDLQRTYFLTMHRLNEKYDDGEILAQGTQSYSQVPTQSMVYADMRMLARNLTAWLLDNQHEL